MKTPIQAVADSVAPYIVSRSPESATELARLAISALRETKPTDEMIRDACSVLDQVGYANRHQAVVAIFNRMLAIAARI